MTAETTLTPYEQLAEEVDRLAARITSLDARGLASKWIRQKDRELTYVIAPRRDEDVTMRWMRELKASLERQLADVLGERAQHAADVQAVKFDESARHSSLTARAHARIDPALFQAEAAKRAAVEAAQQSRDAAQRALTDHEAHVPNAAERPAWQRTRRDLMEAIEDAALNVAEMAAAHADAQRAFRAACSAAWGELTSEIAEQFSARLEAAQAVAQQAQEALAIEEQAGRDALQDVRTARLLDT